MGIFSTFWHQIAAGTVAVLTFFSFGTPTPQAVAPVATSTPAQASASAPVRARVASSSPTTTHVAPATASTPTKGIVRTMDTQTAQACQEISAISASSNSLTSQIQALCTKLSQPTPDTQSAADSWASTAQQIQKKLAGLKSIKNITAFTWDTSLLKTFVANPTPETFRTLCGKASTVNVPTNKEALSADRTTMVFVPKTLYDIMRCDLLSNNFTAIAIVPGLLQWDLKSDDTNNIREAKIYYSDRLKTLLGNYSVVVVESTVIPSIDASTHHLIVENESEAVAGATFNGYVPEDRAVKLISDPTSVGSLQLALDSQTSFGVRGTLKK